MAKKGFFGKLLTATAAVAAIGGTCYIFKDKIKESKLYEDLDIENRLKQLKSLLKKDDEEDDDFFDEDEYIFESDDTEDAEDTKRNYVPLNTKTNTDDEPKKDDADDEPIPDKPDTDTKDEFAAGAEEDIVPTISLDTFGDSEAEDLNTAENDDTSDMQTEHVASDTFASDTTKDDTPIAYDMEGLSDVSEDPDVLIEQDLLDDGPYYL